MTKKFILSGLLLVSVLNLNAADCSIISSPATNLDKVTGVDARAETISRFFYDENKKMKLKNYPDAYIEFFKNTLTGIKADCKKYNISHIYNLKVTSTLDDNYYYFSVTYDY